ncbi:unnamed protein product, partial [Symbiodinium pilosum]
AMGNRPSDTHFQNLQGGNSGISDQGHDSEHGVNEPNYKVNNIYTDFRKYGDKILDGVKQTLDKCHHDELYPPHTRKTECILTAMDDSLDVWWVDSREAFMQLLPAFMQHKTRALFTYKAPSMKEHNHVMLFKSS